MPTSSPPKLDITSARRLAANDVVTSSVFLTAISLTIDLLVNFNSWVTIYLLNLILILISYDVLDFDCGSLHLKMGGLS